MQKGGLYLQIIVKFILKNIQEKKFRTFLILLSILLSTALFFASNAISSSVTKTIVKSFKNFYGEATIKITPKPDKDLKWVRENMIPKHPNIEQVVGIVNGGATYEHSSKETTSFSLLGTELNELSKINKIELLTPLDSKDFQGRKIIVSKKFATKHQLKEGDKIPLKIQNNIYRFQIAAIAAPSSLFGNEVQSSFGLIPKNVLAGLMGASGKSSEILIKTTKDTKVKPLIKELSQQLKIYDVEVKEPIDAADLAKQLSNITLPFMMITMLVLIMSVFIIYTSFKVITMERLPILGTFRSIGATEKMTRRVLLFESMIYGALGGILSIPTGIAILSAMLSIVSKMAPEGQKVSMAIDSGNIIASLILAFMVSLVSSYIPIRKASKLPLKDIVLGTLETKKKKKHRKLIFGSILFILSLILPYIVPRSIASLVGGLCIFTLVTSTLMIIPLITKSLVLLFENIYAFLFGNEGILAIKNLKDNDNINQNITLLSLSISTLLVVTILSGTMQSLLSSMYKGAKFDLFTLPIGSTKLDKPFVSRIQAAEAVDKVYPVYQTRGTKVVGTDSRISEIESANPNLISTFLDIDLVGSKDPLPILKKLQEDRYLIASNAMLNRVNGKVGDTLILDTPRGKKQYTILAEAPSLHTDALAGESYVRSDFKIKEYSFLYIRSQDPEKAVKSIKKVYDDKNNYTMTLKENEDMNRQGFGVIFGILQGFAIILLVIGIFGIINNLIINFLQRKRAIAMYKSVGMSKKQLNKISLIEAVTAGVFGGIIGMVTAVLELNLVFKLLSSALGTVTKDYSIEIFVIALIAAIFITLIGSIVPLLQGQKLQIIEAIKYE